MALRASTLWVAWFACSLGSAATFTPGDPIVSDRATLLGLTDPADDIQTEIFAPEYFDLGLAPANGAPTYEPYSAFCLTPYDDVPWLSYHPAPGTVVNLVGLTVGGAPVYPVSTLDAARVAQLSWLYDTYFLGWRESVYPQSDRRWQTGRPAKWVWMTQMGALQTAMAEVLFEDVGVWSVHGGTLSTASVPAVYPDPTLYPTTVALAQTMLDALVAAGIDENYVPQHALVGLDYSNLGTGIQQFIAFPSFAPGPVDYGDLNDTGGVQNHTGSGNYRTLKVNDGPRHVIVDSAQCLGAALDGEIDARQAGFAGGDGISDDGVTFPGLVAGRSANVGVNANVAGYLNAWIDWNDNGDFEAGERIATDAPLTAGNSSVSITVPGDATTGKELGARFRFTTGAGQVSSPYGVAPNGEVEDYPVVVTTPPPTAARLSHFTARLAAATRVDLAWGTLVENGVLGFHLDRGTVDGDWSRLTSRLVPAQGSDGRPQTYVAADAQAPLRPGLRYRLIEVDLQGREHPLAETTLPEAFGLTIASTDGDLRLDLRGRPDARVTLQSAARVVGPWTSVEQLTLDRLGATTTGLGRRNKESARFYRVLIE